LSFALQSLKFAFSQGFLNLAFYKVTKRLRHSVALTKDCIVESAINTTQS
jgi:hypothetical protein